MLMVFRFFKGIQSYCSLHLKAVDMYEALPAVLLLLGAMSSADIP
jgi:hypothetical protein